VELLTFRFLDVRASDHRAVQHSNQVLRRNEIVRARRDLNFTACGQMEDGKKGLAQELVRQVRLQVWHLFRITLLHTHARKTADKIWKKMKSMVRYAVKVCPLTNMSRTEHDATLGIARLKTTRRWETAREQRRRDRTAQMTFAGPTTGSLPAALRDLVR
jgi:hypothetical protein